jgi:cytidylate kinase
MNTKKQLPPVITIDGPGGSGKGTVSHYLAKHLGWHCLDSGVIYRALAYYGKIHHLDLENEELLAENAAHLDLVFDTLSTDYTRAKLGGNDVTRLLRTEECGNIASKISAFPKVRQALLERQRQFRQWPGLVTDGRDMGSVVFPDAELKIFLDASIEVRAERRYLQLQQHHPEISFEQIYQEVAERDTRDRHREVAPLIATEDAVTIDTSDLSVDEVFMKVLAVVKERFSGS